MKTKYSCAEILLMSTLMAGVAEATESSKETTLSYVGAQGTRPIQPSTENTAWVNFAGAVDNSLPMYGTYCQVTSMYIKAGG